MTLEAALVLWTVRLSCLGYVLALAAWIRGRWDVGRRLWIGALLFYLAHVAGSFGYRYQWSHAVAYAETAKQTAARFGWDSGSGIYWNYVFTLVWLVDALWIGMSPSSYRRRPRWLNVAVHVFLAFMFVNAVIVFPVGWIRWAGLGASAWLVWLKMRSRSVHHRRK